LVREQELASEATAFTFDLSKGSDLMVLDVTARPGVGAELLEEALGQELDTLVADGVTAAEVERAVSMIEAAFVISMQSAGERADKLSMFATYLGDPRLLNQQTARYREVTSAQVTSLARQRLGTANRATLVYIPRQGVDAESALASAAAHS
jgi:predicted Zn-dependent peptidase